MPERKLSSKTADRIMRRVCELKPQNPFSVAAPTGEIVTFFPQDSSTPDKCAVEVQEFESVNGHTILRRNTLEVSPDHPRIKYSADIVTHFSNNTNGKKDTAVPEEIKEAIGWVNEHPTTAILRCSSLITKAREVRRPRTTEELLAIDESPSL